MTDTDTNGPADRLEPVSESERRELQAWVQKALCGRPRPACPVCGGQIVEERQHTKCSRCGRITEGCCEG